MAKNYGLYSLILSLLWFSSVVECSAPRPNPWGKPLANAILFVAFTTAAQWGWSYLNNVEEPVDWKSLILKNITHAIKYWENSVSPCRKLAYPQEKAGTLLTGVAYLATGAWMIYRAQLLLNAQLGSKTNARSYFPSQDTTNFLANFSPYFIYLNPLVLTSICHEGGHYLFTRLLAPWMETTMTIAGAGGPSLTQYGVLPQRSSQAIISASGGIVGGLSTWILKKWAERVTKNSTNDDSSFTTNLANRIITDAPYCLIEQIDNILLPWKTDSQNIHQALGITPLKK